MQAQHDAVLFAQQIYHASISNIVRAGQQMIKLQQLQVAQCLYFERIKCMLKILHHLESSRSQSKTVWIQYVPPDHRWGQILIWEQLRFPFSLSACLMDRFDHLALV